jgi:single-strand DNA-binding protein
MSNGLNMVVLFGNLGADPELRTSQSGTSVLTLRLATTETYFDKNQQKQERTEWHRIKVFGNRADALAKILAKGEAIGVDGRVSTSSYEKNGEKRYATEIIARDIYLGGRRPQTNGALPPFRAAAEVAATDLPF